jgi:CheY-like chemotaxis protein/HPt (histidine-containing phosphotransfer) domain-containing protein
VLFVKKQTEAHAEQQRMMQSARDRQLEFERLVKQTQNNEILVHCIVHDLNGPLTGMMGCLDLLDLQDLTPKARDLVRLGVRQALSQKAMIRGILDAFSAEVESLHHVERDPSLAPDLYRLTRATVENYTPVAKTRDVALELSTTPPGASAWKVAGESGRLERVLANLVENALRHSPSGSTVGIRLKRAGGRVLCEVHDQGPGVPADIADTLFEKFTKTADGGGKAGLGLYFCRITVERWGGTIGHRPRESGGTCFWFRLDEVGQPPRTFGVTRDRLAGRELLLIEDDDVTRALVSEVLRASGASITEVSNGESVLTSSNRGPYDAVLLDIHLPGMSGFDVAAHLRERSLVTGPIIAVTADVFAGNSDRGEVFDEIIRKPFSADHLRSVLERRLSDRPAVPAGETVEGTHSTARDPANPPGLEIDRALDRIGGNDELLHQLLARFEARCRHATRELRDLVAEGDTESAARLAHSLKGTAANLGASGVHRAALKIEEDLQSGGHGTGPLNRDLEVAVTELSSSLRGLGIDEETS